MEIGTDGLSRGFDAGLRWGRQDTTWEETDNAEALGTQSCAEEWSQKRDSTDGTEMTERTESDAE
jgi:hypothetical protein